MSSAAIFIIIAIVFCLLLAIIIVSPWLRKQRTQDNSLLTLNVALFKERLAELAADKAQGILDEVSYNSQKLELEKQLLQVHDEQQTDRGSVHRSINKTSIAILLVWIPVLIGIGFLSVASRNAVFVFWQTQDKLAQVADDLLTHKIEQPPPWAVEQPRDFINVLITNVHAHANEPERWLSLSEIFIALQAKEPALEALNRAHRLQPDDEKLSMLYAQTSFFALGGQLTPDIRQLVSNILNKNPKHEGAQMLMAMAETQAGNLDKAQYWVAQLKQSLLSKPGDHSQALTSLQQLGDTIAQKQQAEKHGISLMVQVAPALVKQIKTTDTLFIAIRDIKGGAPYAAKRLSASELNNGQVSITLSDNDSMMPSQKLSTARKNNINLVAIAKVSKTGDATAQKGDLTSLPVPLAGGQTQVNVVVNGVVP